MLVIKIIQSTQKPYEGNETERDCPLLAAQLYIYLFLLLLDSLYKHAKEEKNVTPLGYRVLRWLLHRKSRNPLQQDFRK